MAARPQWYFWSIGLTNRVQQYCRLAIITMQMMPKTSCPQRVASDAVACSVCTFDDAREAIPGFLPVHFLLARTLPNGGGHWARARARRCVQPGGHVIRYSRQRNASGKEPA